VGGRQARGVYIADRVMSRIGIRVENDPRLSLADLVEIAVAAETAGVESVWVPEGGGRDALSLLAAFGGATTRLRLATGILPIFSRTPAVTAMSATGMAAISGDRFVLGLGTGHGPVVQNTHGVPYFRPLARMEETVSIVKSLIEGGSVSESGHHFEVTGARLGRATAGVSTPVYVAALGPKMIALSGRLADGVLLNWTAAEHIAVSVATLHQAASAAGRDPSKLDAAGYVRTAVIVGNEEPAIRKSLQAQIAGYAAHPYYRNFFVSTGFGKEMDEAERALSAGDSAAAEAAISEKMQSQVAVVGTPEQCREEIERRRRLGLQLPVVAPFAVDDDVKGAYLRAISAFAVGE
jgi:probable F420-dependent oxidoreductase